MVGRVRQANADEIFFQISKMIEKNEREGLASSNWQIDLHFGFQLLW